MITMGGFSLPSRTIREMICASIDVIVQAARLRDGSRRITHITEVMGMEGDTIITQDLFVYDLIGEDANGKIIGRHRSTGIGRPRFWERARYYGEEKRLAAALDAAEVAEHKLKERAMNMQTLALAFLGFTAIGGLAWVFIYPVLSGEKKAESRRASIARPEPAARQADKSQRSRREQVEGSLKELEARRQKEKKVPLTHPHRPRPASTWTTQKFWIISGVCAAVFFVVAFIGRRRTARRPSAWRSPPASACRAGCWAISRSAARRRS